MKKLRDHNLITIKQNVAKNEKLKIKWIIGDAERLLNKSSLSNRQ